MAPDFGLGAQSLHCIVEHLQHEFGIDDIVHNAARSQQMDLRFFHLDHLTTGISKVVQFLIERVADRHDAGRQVFVMLVLNRKSDELRRDGAELHRPRRQTLSGLPDLGVVHFAASDRPDESRHDPRFQIIMQDMSAGKANAPGAGFRQFRMGRFEAVHVVRRIAGPALTANILIEPAVTIGADIKTGHFLFPQVNREGIHILLAESGDDHGVQEGFGSQIFGVPARARQRTRDGC